MPRKDHFTCLVSSVPSVVPRQYMSRVLIFATGCKLLQMLNLKLYFAMREGESGWEVAGLPVKTLQ